MAPINYGDIMANLPLRRETLFSDSNRGYGSSIPNPIFGMLLGRL